MSHSTLNINAWIRKFDLLTLRLFVSITEESQIGRAAAREAIAASAVTKRIQDLEDTLGFKLLYRDPKGTMLTPAGKIVERHARAIMSSVDNLHWELSEFAEGVRGHIRVFATESVLVEYLAEDLSAFSKAFPMVSFDINETESTAVLKAVAAGVADVGICAKPIGEESRLMGTRYRNDRLVAVMNSLHPLAAEPELTFARLLTADLIGWSKTSWVMRMLESAAAESSLEYRPKYRVASVEGARSLVRAGLGVAVQPSGLAWPLGETDGIRSIPLTDSWAQRELFMFVARDHRLSVAVETLLRYLVAPGEIAANAADDSEAN